jgi:hypothetical protein
MSKSYGIAYQYETGDSYSSETRDEELELQWSTREAAEANLRRINEHYSYYRAVNAYRSQKAAEVSATYAQQVWFVKNHDMCLILQTDKGKPFQFNAPWCGFFERLLYAHVVERTTSPAGRDKPGRTPRMLEPNSSLRSTATYPLAFTFRDLVMGNGFVASVVLEGRGLLTEEVDGSFWVYGVQPGGLADGGENRDAALCKFKNGYLSVLYDIAAKAANFAAFEKDVAEFFRQVNAPNRKVWQTVLAKVRRSKRVLDGLDRENVDGKRLKHAVVLVDISKATATQNQFPTSVRAAM